MLKTTNQSPLFKILSSLNWLMAAIAAILVLVTFFVGNELVLPWITDVTYVKSPLFLEYFTINGKPMGFELDQVINWQQFKTGRYLFLAWPEYILFIFTLVAFVVIGVTITYLDRFWYLVCAGIMAFVSINFGLDELGLWNEYFGYAFIGAFLILTYYFQSIKPNTGFNLRLTSTFLVIGLFTIFGLALSTSETPQFLWISFGLLAPLILSAFYIFFVAGDNFYFLFKIATQNAPSGKNGIIHFMSIGAVYILLLILIFLNLTEYISLNLVLINPYTLLMTSVVTGYFVLKPKLDAFESQIPFNLIKSVLYPTLAALTLAIVFYAEISANDSLIRAVKMAIVVPHLAFAVVYYVYCFMNFTPALLDRQPAWKFFFKGERAPLLTARLGALVFILGALFYLEFKPYYQIKAGQYNALGTLAEKTGNDLLAAQYYRQSLFYDYYGARANYSLGMIEKADNNPAQATEKFKQGRIRSNDSKATLALTQYYSERDQLFNKLLTLKEVENPSGDQKILNNLAIAHYEFGHLDTAFTLINQAYKMEATPTISSNFLAIDLSIQESLDVDSVIENTANLIDSRSLANRQALANSERITPTLNMTLAADSFLLMDELYYLYNAAIGMEKGNTTLLNTLEYYANYKRNISVNDYLVLGRAIQHYNLGQVNKAFLILNEGIAQYGNKAGLYSYIKAIWAYHQGAQELSFIFLGEAQSYNFDRKIITNTYSDFVLRSIDEQAVGLKEDFQAFKVKKKDLNEGQKRLQVKIIAQKNAFDERITLMAIDELKTINTTPEVIYEILQQAISINSRSTPLYEAYVYQTAEVGLSFFGRSALEIMETFTSKEEIARITAGLEKRQKQRQQEVLNLNN